MDWLALHLPSLPLEVFTRAQDVRGPFAVSDRGRVLRCNPAAAKHGVHAGLAEGAARTLCAHLALVQRDSDSERAALERLAAYALRFSDHLSLSPPRSLLLESRRSLRLFGGGEALRHAVSDGICGLGYGVRVSLAPTPSAALVLAARGHEGLFRDSDEVIAALAAEPPAVLGLDGRTLDDLARMGIERFDQLLDLPRAGLRARIGRACIEHLERLLGERSDPRERFEPPARYRGRLEPPFEIPESGALLFACRRLIDELAGLLAGRQAGVQRLGFELRHAEAAPTRFELGSAEPLADAARWIELLRERLERLQLPAPVREIRLASEPLRERTLEHLELFPELSTGREPDPALLDRLQARLGRDAVHGLQAAADHRPERAWCWCEPGQGGSAHARLDRPLWLLDEPRELEQRGARPWLGGALDLGDELERIETGWWDGFEVARDYFIATAASGQRLWIFRERAEPRRWFLHGVFD